MMTLTKQGDLKLDVEKFVRLESEQIFHRAKPTLCR